jgi:probable F420-dependent oxidoreductase
MKIGAVYPQTEACGDPRNVRAFGLAMESMGLDYVLAFDHVAGASHADRDPPLWGPYTEHDPFHDPMIMFAYLAGMTRRIEFVTGVLILPQRQTVLLAKQATDLDLLSGERLRLGIGTGWNYVEYEALGQHFETRGARMDEQVEFLRKLWAEPLLTFEGRFDRITRGNLNVRPSRQIPIWMGGFAEAAYRRAVRVGDGFIFATVAHADLEKAWGRTRELLAAAGRSEATFGRDYIPLRAAGAGDAADRLRRWRDSGGTHGAISPLDQGFTDIRQHIDFVGEALAKLRTE